MTTSIRPLSVTVVDVCFVHWPVAPSIVRSVIPDWLEPDTIEGSAWVSALPLTMAQFDVFGLPARQDVEGVNLRTYVRTAAGDRGVFFLSLDISDRLAAETASSLFRLPYHYANVRRRREGDRTEVVARRRNDTEARLTITFEPTGEARTTGPDTLASFLVERDRYFTTGPLGTQLVGSVGHPPWKLQPAEVTVTENSLLSAAGIEAADGEALVHYSPGIEMGIGRLEPL